MIFLLRIFIKTKAFIKGILPHSLFGRSLLILVTPIFLVQAITTFMFFDKHWQKMGERLAFSVANEVALISNLVERNDSPEFIEQIKYDMEKPLDVIIRYKKAQQLSGFFDDNRTVFQNPNRESMIAKTLARGLDIRLKRPYNIAVDADEKWIETQVQLSQGVLYVVFPERRIFSSSGYVVLLWMVASSLTLLIIATFFMRNQIKPIRRLAIAAEKFGKGRDVPFFKVEGAREIRQAARAFIDMKDRLGRQIQQRTAMLAGVSHDLRTPLTRMQLQLAMMEPSDSVDGLKSDVADMAKMIEAYLQFAKGEGDEDVVRVNVQDVILNIANTENREKERVYVDSPEPIMAVLRPVAFDRCIGNLVGNALKYGHHAWISVRRIGDNFEICIDDDGAGIPKNQYDDVFKPFFRGEASRNSKTGGVGLGLPIVRDIVHSHGGVIWLDESPKGGLRVVIDLPL